MIGSVRAAILLRRAGVCLLLLVAAQYVFIAVFVYQPYVAVTSSIAEDRGTFNEAKSSSPTVHTKPEVVSSTAIGTNSRNVSERQLSVFSVLRQRLVQFFTPGFAENSGQISLPHCPAPSKYPGIKKHSTKTRSVKVTKLFIEAFGGACQKKLTSSFEAAYR